MFGSNTLSVNTANLFLTPGRLVETLLLWHERSRQRMALAELDERTLKDLGLTRGQVAAEAGKPFWQV
jgi:uncharacterized protein YjiS (DUF1127 family)